MPLSPNHRDDTGAGVVEYVLLIVAVALTVLLAMSLLGDRLGGTFGAIAAAVGSEGTGAGAPDGHEPEITVPGSGIAWDPDAVYVDGDTVEYDGRIWEADWWTRNQPPGDPNGPWQEMATTGDGTAVWTASRIFDTGDVVIHDGVRYRAKWWTRNQPVDTPHGPWERID